jgi:hypothetical protein
MARAPSLASMSVEQLLKLREDVGKVLSQKAVQLEHQLDAGWRGQHWTTGPPKRDEGQEGSCQISRQGGQHLGRTRSSAPVAAGEAQSRRQVGRLRRRKDHGSSQGCTAENKEAATQEVMSSLRGRAARIGSFILRALPAAGRRITDRPSKSIRASSIWAATRTRIIAPSAMISVA